MTIEEVIALRVFINEAYPFAKMDQTEGDVTWHIILQECNAKEMQDVVLLYIRSGQKYPPSVAELISRYEKRVDEIIPEIVSFMMGHRFFDDDDKNDLVMFEWNRKNRIRKASIWVRTNIMPDWFRVELEKFKNIMKKEELGFAERKLIE